MVKGPVERVSEVVDVEEGLNSADGKWQMLRLIKHGHQHKRSSWAADESGPILRKQ